MPYLVESDQCVLSVASRRRLRVKGRELPPQRLPKHLLPVHDIRVLRLMLGFRPRAFREARIHALIVSLLDTGCRIEELLTARVADFDLDQMLLTVMGKGRKERRVPFSHGVAESAVSLQSDEVAAARRSELMFPSREGSLGISEMRCAATITGCRRLASLAPVFTTPPYVRDAIPPYGGDVVRLSIILGHSDVSTTMRYLHLLTEDLQRPHQSLSILNRLR